MRCYICDTIIYNGCVCAKCDAQTKRIFDPNDPDDKLLWIREQMAISFENDDDDDVK